MKNKSNCEYGDFKKTSFTAMSRFSVKKYPFAWQLFEMTTLKF